MSRSIENEGSIDARVDLITSGKLSLENWTTEEHLILATWVMVRHPEMDAEQEVPRLIRAFNLAVGIANTESMGYHETMTLANLRAIRSVLRELPEPVSLVAACTAVVNSRFRDKRWIFSYWSGPCMMSASARRAWCEPDLQPLPFSL
jgi:hypothetical protein